MGRVRNIGANIGASRSNKDTVESGDLINVISENVDVNHIMA